MITKCDNCTKEFKTLPSWYARHDNHFCCRQCFMIYSLEDRTKNILEIGVKTRFQSGHIPSKNRIMPTNNKHFLWKGNNVGYRGLHYWLRREKGVPTICIHCGATNKIQWANIDGKYRRDITDYIGMCPTCHKNHDIATKLTI